MKVIKATLGIRVSESDEIAGLDTTELGMEFIQSFHGKIKISLQLNAGGFFVW